jgi:hypothetical protein
MQPAEQAYGLEERERRRVVAERARHPCGAVRCLARGRAAVPLDAGVEAVGRARRACAARL